MLVVDNEEADRELIARWLLPLGFDVLPAHSGLDALARLEELQPGGPGAPHAIFMDLAMPGIDGWETVRRLRSRGWGHLPLAIVSANAFDRGLQSDIEGGRGHRPQDFFVKPVRRDDLLAWLAQHLSLQWIAAAAPTTPPETAALPVEPPPDRAELAPLLEQVRLGYTRGIVQWLDDWVERRPGQAQLAARLRSLAREFRFDAIEELLTRLPERHAPERHAPE